MNPRDNRRGRSALHPYQEPAALNEVWGMNPRDSCRKRPVCRTRTLATAQRSLGHEPQRQSVGSSALRPLPGAGCAQRSLGHEPQRQARRCRHLRTLIRRRPAQRSLGHEPQRQLPWRPRRQSAGMGEIAQRSLGHEPQRQLCRSSMSSPCTLAATLNEVWGINPRDRPLMGAPGLGAASAQLSLGHEPQRQV